MKVTIKLMTSILINLMFIVTVAGQSDAESELILGECKPLSKVQLSYNDLHIADINMRILEYEKPLDNDTSQLVQENYRIAQEALKETFNKEKLFNLLAFKKESGLLFKCFELKLLRPDLIIKAPVELIVKQSGFTLITFVNGYLPSPSHLLTMVINNESRIVEIARKFQIKGNLYKTNNIGKTIKKVLPKMIVNERRWAPNTTPNAYTLFSQNGKQISKKEYLNELKVPGVFDVSGDSLHHRILIKERKTSGRISDFQGLRMFLQKRLKVEIPVDKPLVILYYQGKDLCNSTGTDNILWIKNSYDKLESKIDKCCGIKPIYLYKFDSGMDRYKGVVNWKKDPENEIGNLFFKYRYPCGSFVVIAPNGNYVAYLGEYSNEGVHKATEDLMNLN